MLRVGLTGGIACGKSVVLGRLAGRGLATLDLDALAHELMAPGGAAYADVVSAFGRGILDDAGAIDRRSLGSIVFADAGARALLEGIVHPRVRAEESARAARLETEGRELLVSDAALLVEAGAHLRFDRLVVVHCPVEEQARRLVARDGLDAAAARARISAQMPIGEKRRFGHLEVDTSGSLDDTARAADILAGVLLTEARGPRAPAGRTSRPPLGALAYAGRRGPRGLDPLSFLETTAESGGLEMATLARLLRPAGNEPWYRLARANEGRPWPEALAMPLAVWALARGADQEWLAGAAGSLARLTHRDDATVAGAVLASLLAHDVAREGSLRPLADRSGDREERARRWGRATPAPRVGRARNAALAHPDDPVAAGARAEAAGGEAGFAAALVGAAGAVVPPDVDPALRRLVDRLG